MITALEEKGQCTLDGRYWGRTCCGQSIVLDHVIQVIAYEWYTNHLTVEPDQVTPEPIDYTKVAPSQCELVNTGTIRDNY